MLPFAFLGSLGPMEIAIVGGVMLMLFGNRLPSVMRSLGKSVVEFKKGLADSDEPNGTAAAGLPAPAPVHAD